MPTRESVDLALTKRCPWRHCRSFLRRFQACAHCQMLKFQLRDIYVTLGAEIRALACAYRGIARLRPHVDAARRGYRRERP